MSIPSFVEPALIYSGRELELTIAQLFVERQVDWHVGSKLPESRGRV